MSRHGSRRDRSRPPSSRKRTVAPLAEVLEGRLLLYSKLGDQFTYSSRITYSFMPDGTSVGGVPSALFANLNAKFPTATWEAQISQAASIWENAANLNLARVSDGGQPVGTSGAQQDDPRFGDIRIGAVPLSAGTLAVTFLPPPANGGTDAADILLNSNINWQINSNYDLMTVMAHEFGHALGLGDVSTPTNPYPVMYGNYVGISQALTADDTAGIQAVDGVRKFDAYNQGTRNLSYQTAPNISGSFGSNAQLAIPSLDITTGGDSEWFYVAVPSTTTGTMTISVQSSNLSSLSPKLMVYNSSLGLVGQALAPNSMGATVSVSTAVKAGQGYYIKVLAAPGYGAIGAYGLLVNAGSQTQAPIPPPNTYVAQQPDLAGGSAMSAVKATTETTTALPLGAVRTDIGTLSGWSMVFTTATAGPLNTPAPSLASSAPLSAPAGPVSTAPLVPVAAPAPVSVAPLISFSKHHAKAKQQKPPKHPAVVHRIKLVHDHRPKVAHRGH